MSAFSAFLGLYRAVKVIACLIVLYLIAARIFSSMLPFVLAACDSFFMPGASMSSKKSGMSWMFDCVPKRYALMVSSLIVMSALPWGRLTLYRKCSVSSSMLSSVSLFSGVIFACSARASPMVLMIFTALSGKAF